MDADHDPAAEDEEVAETDPEGRYYRYQEVVGRGRFKCIYKAFDTQIGGWLHGVRCAGAGRAPRDRSPLHPTARRSQRHPPCIPEPSKAGRYLCSCSRACSWVHVLCGGGGAPAGVRWAGGAANHQD